MPVVIHWAANFLLGLTTARAVRGAPGLFVGNAPWPLLFLSALQAIFITPCITYLFRYWSAWSMFYQFDPTDYPMLDSFIGLLSGAVVCINFFLMWLGFVCGRRSLGPQQKAWAQWPALVCASMIGLCVAYLGERIAYAGDYDVFWRGQAPLCVYTPAGWVGLGMLLVSAGFVLILHRRYAQRDPVFI